MHGLRLWWVVAMLAGAGQVTAQVSPRPQPSVLWAVPSPESLNVSGHVLRQAASPKERGLLIGALFGGVAAGFLGNRVCHAYSATASDACVGDTLWWAALGGMLGGLIGATGAGERDQ
jgi:hypothetical protein